MKVRRGAGADWLLKLLPLPHVSHVMCLQILRVRGRPALLPASAGHGLCLPGGGADALGQRDPRRLVRPLQGAADGQAQGNLARRSCTEKTKKVNPG